MSQTPADSAAPEGEGAAPTPADASPPQEPAPASPSDAASADAESKASGTTLAILGVVVVILAVVLAVQVPLIQVKLHFRKLQAGLAQPKPVVEESALEALQAKGPELLTHLADELEAGGPQRERFRIFLIAKLLSPMEGDPATQVLIALAADKSPAVRANVYAQLVERSKAGLMDEDLARETLATCWAQEKDEIAKTYAANCSVRLKDPRATWALIVGLRHVPSRGAHIIPELVETLKLALGPIELDLKASPEEIQRQMLAIEATYVEQGGKIPPGQDLKSVLEKRAASASGGAGQ